MTIVHVNQSCVITVAPVVTTVRVAAAKKKQKISLKEAVVAVADANLAKHRSC